MPILAACLGGVGGAALLGGLGSRSVRFLGKDEQLRVEGLTEVSVINGPGMKFISPLYKTAQRIKARMLGAAEFVKVIDTVKSTERIEQGPQLLFLGAYEDITQTGEGLTLGPTEYIFVVDKSTGVSRTVKGPCVWYPTENDEPSGKRKATALQEDEYVRLKDERTGRRWVCRGKAASGASAAAEDSATSERQIYEMALVFLEPSWIQESGVTKAWTLKATEYVRLLDTVSGNVSVHRGPQIVFPGAHEKMMDGDKLTAIDLKVNEYVKVEDMITGEVRVVAGVDRVILGRSEVLPDGGKKKAHQIDEEHAILVRDTSSGQLRLVTQKQLYVPTANEVIEEVRKLITLAEHEACIVKNKDGNSVVHYGNAQKAKAAGTARSFFLEPYSELVQLWWSSGLRRAKRDLCIEYFDCRAQFMWFEFDCRTSDNVELILECTFFWEVVDLEILYKSTGNLPGDIYNQARSQFIKKVALKKLKEFMDDLHNISQAIYNEDQAFYTKRGVKIHSLEVTKYKCSEARTSEVLQQIIEETTNRLNRRSIAEGENEVQLFKIEGEIQKEERNKVLLQHQHENVRNEAEVKGRAEAQSVAAFLEGIEKMVPKLEDRIGIWQTLRKNDALSTVSTGGASLYYTPNDIDLSIKS